MVKAILITSENLSTIEALAQFLDEGTRTMFGPLYVPGDVVLMTRGGLGTMSYERFDELWAFEPGETPPIYRFRRCRKRK